jgi:hypothetical protein
VRFIHALLRTRRAAAALAVAGLLGGGGLLVAGGAPASAGPLTVTLSATDDFGQPASTVWTGEGVKFTATASGNIGADRLNIVDLTLNAQLITCAAGQNPCTGPAASIANAAPGANVFEALLRAPGGQVVATWDISVVWQVFPVTLQAQPTALPVGQAATLTATTTRSVTHSPWWIEIFDLTSDTLVCQTGGGSMCQGSVTENAATTHQFAAFIANKTSTVQSLDVQSNSAISFVTWSNDGWRVSLATTAPGVTTNTSEAVTATTNIDVGTSATLYTLIFDERTNQLLKDCPSGTVCQVNFSPSFAGDNLVAFVALGGANATYVPAGIEASSNVVYTQLAAG